MTHCDKITDEGLKYLGACSKLDLSSCTRITDEGLKYLGTCRILDLSECVKITDIGVKYLNCKELSLYGCKNVNTNKN